MDMKDHDKHKEYVCIICEGNIFFLHTFTLQSDNQTVQMYNNNHNKKSYNIVKMLIDTSIYSLEMIEIMFIVLHTRLNIVSLFFSSLGKIGLVHKLHFILSI